MNKPHRTNFYYAIIGAIAVLGLLTIMALGINAFVVEFHNDCLP